jgi:hypothetical protein
LGLWSSTFSWPGRWEWRAKPASDAAETEKNFRRVRKLTREQASSSFVEKSFDFMGGSLER